ncbi:MULTISPECIES: tetratricopeptide repeat protein [Aliivibrio]|uniref:tetratricopeptide repeat protein n=1 Tax=Aliivibrio TaxID=511678 RepID=UPI0013ED97A0|nr:MULTISPECIES: tetratricopeptide repeat protein [Aliivibrio]MDD9177562.1 tetratricopeptide repeat protein [Aliivibrio sp. A6]
MSATNKALLNITKQDVDIERKTSLSQADVPNIESKFKAPFFFAIGVMSSLCLIGWATLSNTPNAINNEHQVSEMIVEDVVEHSELSKGSYLPVNSPTAKIVTSEVSRIYLNENIDEKPLSHHIELPKVEESSIRVVNSDTTPTKAKEVSIVPDTPREQAISQTEPQEQLHVEEVEVLPSELAQRNRDAAKKALDNSDFNTAMKAYYRVLKYQPSDEDSRKKLAALLYGKREIQESAAILQQGIRLNNDSIDLRLALASLLQKEEQPEAALSALEYIPLGASVDYLATRGGLAQKLKLMDLAEESYQMLVATDPDNGRWWLGLAIVYERNAQVKNALKTYKVALTTPGLSRSSQVFVRDRIKLLETMEGNE